MNHCAGNPQCSVGGIVKQPQAFEFICQPAPMDCLIEYRTLCVKERMCKNRFKLMFLISSNIFKLKI